MINHVFHLQVHTLDLVITRSAAVPFVSNFCIAEQPISDLKAITINLTLRKAQVKRRTSHEPNPIRPIRLVKFGV